MTDTEILQNLDIELSGDELDTHIVCSACYPELVPFKTYSLCGVLLAGIPRTRDTLNCDDCCSVDYCPRCGVFGI